MRKYLNCFPSPNEDIVVDFLQLRTLANQLRFIDPGHQECEQAEHDWVLLHQEHEDFLLDNPFCRRRALRSSLSEQDSVSESTLEERSNPGDVDSEVEPVTGEDESYLVITYSTPSTPTPEGSQHTCDNYSTFEAVISTWTHVLDSTSAVEALVEDVLYSVVNIMGKDGETWKIGHHFRSIGINVNGALLVSFDQVTLHLAETFELDPDVTREIVNRALQRQAADIYLILHIIEAKDLRPKTVKGYSNPYVTMTILETNETHRTRTENETLYPKWNQHFKMKIHSLQKDVLSVNLWHDYSHLGKDQLADVKDINALSRLFTGASARVQHHSSHLLGKIEFPIKDIGDSGMDGWFQLQKESPQEKKERGTIHIEAHIENSSEPPAGGRRLYDVLLAKLVYHGTKTWTNNNDDLNLRHWKGELEPEAYAALTQHAIMMGLSDHLQQLSWWIVCSKVPCADPNWLLQLLHLVQTSLSGNKFSSPDLEDLSDSLDNWQHRVINKIHNLTTAFSSKSRVIAQYQLASCLKSLACLETNKFSRMLLDDKGVPDLFAAVKTASLEFVKMWWLELMDQKLKGVKEPEAQLESVIAITQETIDFLCLIGSTYGPTFSVEMKIPFFQEAYLYLSKKISPCVRPLLMNLYAHIPDVKEVAYDETEKAYVLASGSLLWQLYVNIGSIKKLGDSLPSEVHVDSGVHEYHKWFTKGLLGWLEIAMHKSRIMIEKAVEFDSLDPGDVYCDFSSSATDTIGIFLEVKIWWQKLNWPDIEKGALLLTNVLQDISSNGTRYSELLKNRLDDMFQREENSDQIRISKKICIALNNIEKVRMELTKFPKLFGIDEHEENLIQNVEGGQQIAQNLRQNIDRIIESASEDMEVKVMEFIEAVLRKMQGTLEHAVVTACEAGSGKPLLDEVLEPALRLLHSSLVKVNFERFLKYLWDSLLQIFHTTITRNTGKRKASYFNGIHHILRCCLKFFCPEDGVGLSAEEANSQEYMELMELLECLRLSAENLIAKYYSERLEEQQLSSIPSRAQLVVKALFSKAGKLVVEVIMASDMMSDIGSIGSKRSLFSGAGSPVDSYVKVQLVPTEWFPQCPERKTRPQRKCDPAVYEETFELDLTPEDNGVSSGYILFTLKDYNLARSNTFLGEGLIQLNSLPCVDSSGIHNVPNTYLKLTVPGADIGYTSIATLKLRTSDGVGTAFLKRIGKRFPVEHKSRLTGANSDDEKALDKSPRLLGRLKH